jgi:aspartokinase-like uncharacterized kinase
VKPFVVKIGGSLAETGRLKEILGIVARAQRPTVIVPGGGPFADAVRNVQAELGFSDKAAHYMAILAMHQTALLMREIAPELVAAETLAAIRAAWKERRVAVWLPAKLCERDKRLPRDWSITSDGLAARLAERLGRALVVLVKSRQMEQGASASALAREGVVDPVFAEIQACARIEWAVVGPGEEERLAAMLQAPFRATVRRGAALRKLPSKRRRLAARVFPVFD